MTLKRFAVGASALVSLIVGGFLSVTSRAVKPNAVGRARPVDARFRAVEGYGNLPLSFEANRGQTDARVRFLARGQGYTLFLTSQGAVISLQRSEASSEKDGKPKNRNSELAAGRFAPFSDPSPVVTERAKPPDAPRPTNAVLQMQLVGANANGRMKGEEELPGKSNYFIGNDPKKWRTNIATYAKVRVEDVYPGVDLVYYGNQGQLEYDFVVKPGGDAKAIRLALSSPAKIDGNGDLLVAVDGGEVRFHKPGMYQPAPDAERSTERIPVDGAFAMNAQRKVAFDVAAYDKSKPLVIDPVLVYSTYLGGSAYNPAYAIAVDSAGSAYVTGLFNHPSDQCGAPCMPFPATPGAYDTNTNASEAGFVTKLNPSGTALVYSTYFPAIPFAIAVDSSGNAYLTGSAGTGFPTTPNAFQTALSGFGGAFATKLNPDGSALVYSTYLGGSGSNSHYDSGSGIAIDGLGNAYVTGQAFSHDFPTVNPIQAANQSASYTNAFVTKLNSTGSALVYSTYLGGSFSGSCCWGDSGSGIAVDSSGSAYVTGTTYSSDFPTTSNAFQGTLQGSGDAFATKISPDGSSWVYSTYLGGSGGAASAGITADSSGNAYVAGGAGPAFPTTSSAFQRTAGGGFVTKLSPDGSTLIYSTYLGGSSGARCNSIAVDSSGDAYVTGFTFSTDFPTANPIQATNHGGADAFVAEFKPDGSAPVYSTYLGGYDIDSGSGIAVDTSGNAYVTGYTQSSDFPTTPAAFQSTNHGYNNAFVAEISPATYTADLMITNVAPSSAVGGLTLTYTIAVVNSGPDTANNVNVLDAIPAGTTFGGASISGGSCTTPVPGTTGMVTCTVSSLASGSSITETLVVNVNATDAPLSTIRDTATVSSAAFDPTSADNSATAATTVI